MDLNKLRKLAGLEPLVESTKVLTEKFKDSDEDDDMSASERALVKKAESDLAKKGIKVKDVDPDKEIEKMAAAEKAKREAKKAAAPAKKEQVKTEPKKEEAKEEAKARGRKVGEKASGAREYFTKNKPSRGDFIRHAVDKLGMSTAHANTMYYGLKKKLNEFYLVKLPIGGKFIAEYSSFDRPTFVSFEDNGSRDVMVFETENAAMHAVAELRKYGMHAVAEKVSINEAAYGLDSKLLSPSRSVGGYTPRYPAVGEAGGFAV